MVRTLSGKTAVVTGSSRSIGRAIAERLAADGALVGVHYSNGSQAAAETADAIEAAGGGAFTFGAELGVDGDVRQFWSEFDEQRAKYTGHDKTGVDILVNNVGVALRDPFETATPADFDKMYAVNVRAPFFIVQQGMDRLSAGGRVINISSVVTRLALTDVIVYGTTKGALDTFTLILAKVLGGRSITVNSVAPGFIDTDSNAEWLRADEQSWSDTAAKSALGRVGRSEDVADVVAFLASEDARWITGQVIDVSGGTRL
ncbi:SDR family oxidoreductase [Kibdelosporangium phytohabitans]|uniref:Short-chain dehydrogenase n=1 Tax=Kibdelosporangium phytohabitans TaxID=860235 RepID=A0A0N9HRY8_9PSEU|nr:SDR family oxidoreductase [Kibdelosporangium phytohabitans]ALG09960.1 short-chain dehydrogenase [Kibdelosporangium phytohabitans]MBE1468626.1 NAD(P)-dependent dehydrogenase (short-subunit alcohol dehydrogenase family) [Kibdelosporangium phytohabitans]